MNNETRLNSCNVNFAHKTSDIVSYYSPKCTNDYEIFICIQGKVKYKTDGKTEILHAGDLLLVDRLSYHSAESDLSDNDLYERIIITFPESLFDTSERKAITPLFANRCIYHHAEHLYENLTAIEDAFSLNSLYREIAIKVRIKVLLVELFAMSAVSFGINDLEMDEIIQYIDQHLCDNFSLDNLSEVFHLSKSTLSRRFLKATGSTVADYIQFKRMALAKLMLQNGTPAQVAAELCGYPEYSTFYRNFVKVYQISPKEIDRKR